jgi:purine-binding chemotaxis protein CheW
VVEFDSAKIEPPPKLGMAVQTRFLKGIGKRDERFVIVLDIGSIFEAGDLDALGAGEAVSGSA